MTKRRLKIIALALISGPILGVCTVYFFFPRTTRLQQLATTTSPNTPTASLSNNLQSQPPAEPANAILDELMEPLHEQNRRALLRLQRETQRRQEEAVIASESITETVDYLSTHTRSFKDILVEPMIVSEGFAIRHIESDPRVQKLLSIAINGDPAQKNDLREKLLAYCNYFLTELPDEPRPGTAGFTPSVSSPGNGVTLPYVLAHLAMDGQTLSVFIKMHQRQCAVTQRITKREVPELFESDPDKYIYSPSVYYLSAACDVLLNRFPNDKSLPPISEAERKVLLDAW